MALFKIAKGSASNLSTSTISKKPIEGYCWFTTDDGRFYIDTSTSTNNAVIGTNRIAINGVHTASNSWTAGSSAGPTLSITINDITSTAAAIPSASKTASGIVTTGDQDFNGTKGFGYMARYGRTNTGAATRWVADTWLYNDAGTQVGEFWYDCGDATNITTGQYVLSQYSPNSTANTSTTGKKENYKLPVVASGLTENKNYTIITTKNPADLGYYLPLTGGTLSGDITIAKTGEPALIVNNTSDHKAGFIIGSSSKYAGLWDYTNSKWIVYSTTAGAVTLNGNASTATLPLGFSSQSTNATWGNTTGTTVTAWNDSSGGSIDFRKDNPSSGKLSIKVDGRFYGNEGTYPAMLMNYNNGYWGLGSDPDGGYSGWVRAPASGILTSAKNASSVGSGIGAIGAIEWRFAHVYADTLHGNAETATKANGLVDGSSTMTSAYNKAGLAYGDYTWLAGWNGYELRAVNKSQFAQASHSHAYLPLAGGTMNDEKAITFQITRKKDGGGGWAYSPIRMIGNNNAMFFNIGVYGSANTLGYAYIGANDWNSTANTRIYADGHLTAPKVYGAVWNDYAEYRICKENPKPGRCVIETGKDDLVLSTERLQPGAEIVSDTFGFAIGETDEAKTPIATTGRVLAYIYEGREAALAAIGKPVCSGPDGTVSIMTDEEYQKYGYCAIGTISAVPDYEEWGTGNIKVNNRIWIRIR